MSPDIFLEGMRKLAGAVHIVTTLGPDGERLGLTATAVCSLSVSPPSILACVNRKTWVAQFVASRGVFAVNVLTHADETLARVFAGQTSLSAGEVFGRKLADGRNGRANRKRCARLVRMQASEKHRSRDTCHSGGGRDQNQNRSRTFFGLSRWRFSSGRSGRVSIGHLAKSQR